MKPLVYLAGPYSRPDPVENLHRAVMLADRVLSAGVVTPVCPHLSLAWQAIRPRPYDDWLAYDLELMRRCDAVYRFGGESAGADAEVKEAERLGIPVFHSIDDVYEWADGRTA